MDHKKNLETCLVIVTGLVIIFIFKRWFPLLIAAGLIGLTGIFFNKPASWITWLWFKIADILGKIVQKVLLSVIYYFFLFPLALLSRIFKRKQLSIKSRKEYSQWIEREYSYSEKDMDKPW
jgi:hypothetical protein